MTDADFQDWLQAEVRSGRMTTSQRDDLMEQKRFVDLYRTEIEQQFPHPVVGYVGGMREVSATLQELLAQAQRRYRHRMVYFEPAGLDLY